MSLQRRGHLVAWRLEARLGRRLPTFGATIVRRFAASSASSCCCAGGLTSHGRELLAVDGTRIKAANNKDRNFTRLSLRAFIRAADARLEDYLAARRGRSRGRGDKRRGAHQEPGREDRAALSEKRGRYQAMLVPLERTGEDQISLTDPDSRASGRPHLGRRRL